MKNEAKVLIKRELAGAYSTCDKEVGISPIPMPISLFYWTWWPNKVGHCSTVSLITMHCW